MYLRGTLSSWMTSSSGSEHVLLDAGAHFNEDISVVVAVRTLSAAVYSLFPSEAVSASTVTKAQLHCLRDEGFPWPGEDAVRPELLPALAKNIAKNFMDHFFKCEGRAIVRREVERMKALVISCLLFYAPFLRPEMHLNIFEISCFLASSQSQRCCGAHPCRSSDC